MAAFFHLTLGDGGVAGPRNGQEALGLDGFAAQFAEAVGAATDAVESGVDLEEGILIGGHDAEGEVAIKFIGAGVRHVEAEGLLFLTGDFVERALALAELGAAHDEGVVVLLPFGIDANDVAEATENLRSGCFRMRFHSVVKLVGRKLPGLKHRFAARADSRHPAPRMHHKVRVVAENSCTAPSGTGAVRRKMRNW